METGSILITKFYKNYFHDSYHVAANYDKLGTNTYQKYILYSSIGLKVAIVSGKRRCPWISLSREG